MKKISLTPEQQNVLKNFALEKVPEATLIKSIVKYYLSDLQNVMNIDPKGNMGLQTSARQHATEILEEIFSLIFPEMFPQIVRENSKKSQYR